MNHAKKMVLVPYDKYQDLLKFKEASPSETTTMDSSPYPKDLSPSDAPALHNTDVPSPSTRTNKPLNTKKVPDPTLLPHTNVPSFTRKNKRPSMKKYHPLLEGDTVGSTGKKLYKDL